MDCTAKRTDLQGVSLNGQVPSNSPAGEDHLINSGVVGTASHALNEED